MRLFIGIDPGATGAVAVIDEQGAFRYYGTMPTNEAGEIDETTLYRTLHKFKAETVMVAHEDVHSVHGASAKVNFSFGQNVGISKAILRLTGMPRTMVSPKTWQAIVWRELSKTQIAGLREGAKETKRAKAVTLAAMKALFPKETFLATAKSKVPHEGIVDACAIAYYCLHKYK